MKKKEIEILQGDVVLIDFNPTIGDEIKKIRPAVIINGNFAVGLDLKIVAPISAWKKDFEKVWWLYKISPKKQNGLEKESAVNCYQIRCVSNERLIKKLGSAAEDLEEIIAIVQNCIEII